MERAEFIRRVIGQCGNIDIKAARVCDIILTLIGSSNIVDRIHAVGPLALAFGHATPGTPAVFLVVADFIGPARIPKTEAAVAITALLASGFHTSAIATPASGFHTSTSAPAHTRCPTSTDDGIGLIGRWNGKDAGAISWFVGCVDWVDNTAFCFDKALDEEK